MAGIKRQKRFPIGYRIQNGRAEVGAVKKLP